MSALAGNSDRMGSGAISPSTVVAVAGPTLSGAMFPIHGALRLKPNVVFHRGITDFMLGREPCR
jgi:hypothetical protein